MKAENCDSLYSMRQLPNRKSMTTEANIDLNNRG